jgi:hypothetical protein
LEAQFGVTTKKAAALASGGGNLEILLPNPVYAIACLGLDEGACVVRLQQERHGGVR